MKLTLVNPCWSRSLLPLPANLAELAGHVRSGAGIAVDICDLNVELARTPISGLTAAAAEAVARRRPDVVGLACNTVHVPFVVPLARRLRQALPGAPVILGGHHASSRPEEMLRLTTADYVVRGEGELTLVQLLNHIAGRGPLPHGVSARDGDAVIHRPDRGQLLRLQDQADPAYDLLSLEAYTAAGSSLLSITSSRGCPFSCRFCSGGLHGSLRSKPIDRVLAELQTLTQAGGRGIMFGDDCFTADRRHVADLLPAVAPLDLAWSCLTRLDQMDARLARSLSQAGCTTIYHGVESGVPRLRRFLNKRYRAGPTTDHIRATVASEVAAGLGVVCSFIVGIPTESAADRQATLDLALALRREGAGIQLWILTPYPGAPITREMAAEIIAVDRWDRGHTFDIFSPEQLGLYDGLMPEIRAENPDLLMFRPQDETEAFFRFYRAARHELEIADPALTFMAPYVDETDRPRLCQPGGDGVPLNDPADGWRWAVALCDSQAAVTVPVDRPLFLSLRCSTPAGFSRAAALLRQLVEAPVPALRLTRPLPREVSALLPPAVRRRCPAPRGCIDCLELVRLDRRGSLLFCNDRRANLTYAGNRLQLARRRRESADPCHALSLG